LPQDNFCLTYISQLQSPSTATEASSVPDKTICKRAIT